MGLLSQLAPLLGTRRNSPVGGASAGTRFEAELHQHVDERHGRIVERLPSSYGSFGSLFPVGWRAEDLLGIGDGFMPLAEAAAVMRLDENEVVEMVRAGMLEWNGERVRPAIVSVLRVTRSGVT